MTLAHEYVRQVVARGVLHDPRGVLPAGTILYQYRLLPEIATYIVFINTKNLDVLEEHEFENGRTNVISPLDAYVP